ncbi:MULTISPECIES: phosphate uptake regulator PhoU [unclassified Methanoculleus]|uniref:phosphate uptake regulator PhoU n=1 Tax=unclassified Methanoculleus TaxID=2619537 RepID=UPI0025DEEC77|nr:MULTISPECIES: phosphate uptake regulator PhoU [unclassified Methanoculleus]MCK9318623.1 phosphate uptake regulator PhoU [Methanoculleus sp.]MDD2254014.1 phosphate uptake regulator PhoU [Methanoculleus sp.]MDD2787267.1 phosphate uptake regulator PhoU [Methanoculleus sp.]MDD3216868.1 phosphate uptake regulator PhoU [Methanoculleus sp.]MDD4314986.1 phosphate uptake regulator PhoU [Methanoculleus sp.]
MEIRKVQITGGSSYIVSLPKQWIRSANIQKNDPVGLIIQPDGSLLITPKIGGEPTYRTRVFEVGATTDRTYLLRLLVGAYVAGFTAIRLESRGRMPPFALQLVREFTQMAIGQEVVGETDSSITIKDLLNPAEMPLENTLKRMHVLARGMQQDAMAAIRGRDAALARDVVVRDTEVDRLHWLVARQDNLIAIDAALSRRMGIPVHQATYYFQVSRIIERIADHATRVAHNALALIDREVEAATLDLMDDASALALDIFAWSMEAFHSGDIMKANTTLQKVRDLEEMTREISTRVLRYEAVTAIPVGQIADSIRRIGEYSGDICESVINYTVGQES